jgi:exopolyphosphatase/guanosine-5'-triphosphate,3'-diphosphate pyrophosphatase
MTEGDVSRTGAFVDIGTNSIRMTVARLAPDHTVTVLNQQKEVIRLGEGEFSDSRLKPQAMDRCLLVARRFLDLARSYGAEEVVAVATSATRDAENQAEFLDRLRDEAGLDVRVVSGREEARLIWLGVAGAWPLSGRRALFIDIGGGSTEVIVGGRSTYDFLDTLKLGAIRVTTRFLGLGNPDPVTARTYGAMKEAIRSAAVRTIQRAREFPFDGAVGTSGTILNLAQILAHEGRTTREGAIGLSALGDLIRRLCALSLAERRQVPGINPERADILIGGAAVLETLMEGFGLEELRVSERGLRDGLLSEWLARRDPEHWGGENVRERSVLHLGRACRFDEPHARHIGELATALFDSALALGLHDLGESERELLRYASWLHDVGLFLSFSDHHAHSAYMIANADLLGFDKTEVEIMALTAFYHRKKMPRKKHAEFAALSERSRRAVCVLALCLRMAESLDRSHTGTVRSVALRSLDRKRVLLELHAREDCHLEVWGAEEHEKAFAQVFGKSLRVRAYPLSPGVGLPLLPAPPAVYGSSELR